VIESKESAPRNQRNFATVWAELEYLCGKIHHWLYERHEKSSAGRFRNRLNRVLTRLPQNDLAILREEGWSLLHELQNEIALAIQHRKREIQLLERLHESVRHSIDAGEYDATMGASIIAKWDSTALKKRRTILDALTRREGRPGQTSNSKLRRNGIAATGRRKSHSPKDRSIGRKRPA